jgi:hypothetical protein
MFLQAEAISMYLGLNWTHCTGPEWSPLRRHTLVPVSAFQMCTRPSVEPEMTNCESGEKLASSGINFELRWPVNVWRVAPVKASISRMREPFVEMRIVLPSGLNLRPVQSISFSAEIKPN